MTEDQEKARGLAGFRNEIDAALAYDKAAMILFDKFAKFNLIDS